MRVAPLIGQILVAAALWGCGQGEGGRTSPTPAVLDEAIAESQKKGCGSSWSRTFGGAENDFGYAVAADPSGSVVLAGGYGDEIDLGRGPLTSQGGTDVFVAKYDGDGRARWSRSFGGIGEDAGYALATDRRGNVFLAGLFEDSVDFGGDTLTSAAGSALFLVKLSPAGHHLWSVQLDGLTVSELPGIAVDDRGDVVVTGTATLPDSDRGVFAAKYGSGGKRLWMRTASLVADGASYSAAIDATGAVYIAGFFEDTIDFRGTRLTSAGSADVFVAKYDPHGNLVFARSLGGPGAEMGGAVAVGPSGQVLVTGSFMGSIDLGGGPLTSAGGFDVFLAQLDGKGNHVWSRRYGSPAMEMCRSLAVDGAGSIWLTGTFLSGAADLGGGPLVGAGWIDVFAAKYDRRGNHVWSRALGGDQLAAVSSIAASDTGSAFVSGTFTGTADFGSGPQASAGRGDVFLVKLAP